MALSRNTSILVGFGVGCAIAALVFGVMRLRTERETGQLIKAQALPQSRDRQAEETAQKTAPPPQQSGGEFFNDVLGPPTTPQEQEALAKDLARQIEEIYTASPTPER